MPATIGNTVAYAGTAVNPHTANLTLGSNPRRKVVVAVPYEIASAITITGVTVGGTSIIANDRSDGPDENANDTAMKMRWFDYDVPSGTPSGAIPIAVTASATDSGFSFHAVEVLDAADGGPESTAGAETAGGAATVNLTATSGSALIAVGLCHAATQTLAWSGDVTERAENDEPNYTSGSADAGDVSSGTRSVTLTPSGGGRILFRLASYAAYSGGSPSNAPRALINGALRSPLINGGLIR